MIIKLLVEAGNMTPGPAIAQKVGPLGINIGKVISEVNSATKEFKGLKVPVELDVNAKKKTFTLKVFSPPVSELIKKEIGIEKASGSHKKLKVGNLAIEQIIKIAKIKRENMLDKNLKAAVRSVVGSCVSLGVLIENQEPKKVSEQITSGKYDSEINQGKDVASKEKSQKLKSYFDELHEKQEEAIKKEEEAKAAEEAKKVGAAPKVTTETTETKKEEKIGEEEKGKKELKRK